jgi:hypothetical protein
MRTTHYLQLPAFVPKLGDARRPRLPRPARPRLDGSTLPIAAGTHRTELPYQPGLDGLRGLSIIAVLLYHGGVSWAGGGFLGVESFFVLSGFLITS